MKRIVIILLALMVFSCRTAKTVYDSKIIAVHDTVRAYKVVRKINPVKDTLVIQNPCDTSGMLTNFYSRIVMPNGNVTIRSKKNNIIATVNIDSISNVYEEKYRSNKSDSSQISTKVVTKTVYPSWLITSFIFESLIISGYLYFKFIYRK